MGSAFGASAARPAVHEISSRANISAAKRCDQFRQFDHSNKKILLPLR
jgi:hypothetical protein